MTGRKGKGQAAVESVLVIPLLVMLFLCVLQTGLFFFTYYMVNYASYCGARAAIVHCRPSGNPSLFARSAVFVVLSALSNDLNPAVAAGSARCRNLGAEYEVSVTYPCRSIVPIFGRLIDYLPITASTSLPEAL